MNRIVKHLHGKLFVGPKLEPHYYVQYENSEGFEFVHCSKVNISSAQKIAFDVNFERDERRAGYTARKETSRKVRTSKPLTVRNYIAGGSDESDTDEHNAMQPSKAGQEQSGDNDNYEQPFINDSTPSLHSSSDLEPTSSEVKIKPTPKRKRAFLESDDELTSVGSAYKPSQTTGLRSNKLEEEDATLRKKSTASSKYTPLIVLGASSNPVRARSTAPSAEIPVITLE